MTGHESLEELLARKQEIQNQMSVLEGDARIAAIRSLQDVEEMIIEKQKATTPPGARVLVGAKRLRKKVRRRGRSNWPHRRRKESGAKSRRPRRGKRRS